MTARSTPDTEMPDRYRLILDLVAQLEQLGERQHAARGRAEAIRAYSTAWDQPHAAQLERIAGRLARRVSSAMPAEAGESVEVGAEARSWWISRRWSTPRRT